MLVSILASMLMSARVGLAPNGFWERCERVRTRNLLGGRGLFLPLYAQGPPVLSGPRATEVCTERLSLNGLASLCCVYLFHDAAGVALCCAPTVAHPQPCYLFWGAGETRHPPSHVRK